VDGAHVVPPAIKAFRQHDRIYAFNSSTARCAPPRIPISTGYALSRIQKRLRANRGT